MSSAAFSINESMNCLIQFQPSHSSWNNVKARRMEHIKLVQNFLIKHFVQADKLDFATLMLERHTLTTATTTKKSQCSGLTLQNKVIFLF